MKSFLFETTLLILSPSTWAATPPAAYAFTCGASPYSMPLDQEFLIDQNQPEQLINFGSGLTARLYLIEQKRLFIQVARNGKSLHAPSVIDGTRNGQSYLFVDGVYFNCSPLRINPNELE